MELHSELYPTRLFENGIQDSIRKQLLDLADEKYRNFSAGLLPDVNNLLGVRLPELRSMARLISRGNWRSYFETAQSDYFEEIMLQGMVIGYADMEPEERLGYISSFVPKINNWSLCDSFCGGLKFTEKNRGRVWDFLQSYLMSELEFHVRFAVVMMLNYYIEACYIDRVLDRLNRVAHNGYYVKMAVAWAVSVCYIYYPLQTGAFLKENALDDFTHNKSIQKIIESRRVDPMAKEALKEYKRNSTWQERKTRGRRGYHAQSGKSNEAIREADGK